jgi:hypothetical protein
MHRHAFWCPVLDSFECRVSTKMQCFPFFHGRLRQMGWPAVARRAYLKEFRCDSVTGRPSIATKQPLEVEQE